MTRTAALATSAAVLLLSTPTLAVEGGSGIVNGVCGVGDGGRLWSTTTWCGALQGDLLFGRRQAGDAAVGLATSLGTAAFREATWTLGPAGLLPLGRAWVAQLTTGPALSARRGTLEAGLGAWGFVGWRPHNYYGRYSMAWGLTVGYERGLGQLGGSALVIGARLDGALLLIPTVFARELGRRRQD